MFGNHFIMGPVTKKDTRNYVVTRSMVMKIFLLMSLILASWICGFFVARSSDTPSIGKTPCASQRRRLQTEEEIKANDQIDKILEKRDDVFKLVEEMAKTFLKDKRFNLKLDDTDIDTLFEYLKNGIGLYKNSPLEIKVLQSILRLVPDIKTLIIQFLNNMKNVEGDDLKVIQKVLKAVATLKNVGVIGWCLSKACFCFKTTTGFFIKKALDTKILGEKGQLEIYSKVLEKKLQHMITNSISTPVYGHNPMLDTSNGDETDQDVGFFSRWTTGWLSSSKNEEKGRPRSGALLPMENLDQQKEKMYDELHEKMRKEFDDWKEDYDYENAKKIDRMLTDFEIAKQSYERKLEEKKKELDSRNGSWRSSNNITSRTSSECRDSKDYSNRSASAVERRKKKMKESRNGSRRSSNSTMSSCHISPGYYRDSKDCKRSASARNGSRRSSNSTMSSSRKSSRYYQDRESYTSRNGSTSHLERRR